nr:hypothetical protein [Tanacetum cinerariifolium]
MVDGTKVIISEASIRRDLQFGDEEGVDCLPTATIFEQLALMGRVKKLERRKRSRTHGLKRLYKIILTARVDFSTDEASLGEDASKQGRISYIADEGITLVSTHNDAEMFDVDQDLRVTTAATTTTISIDEVTLAQALAELKHTKPKAKAKGIVFHEPEESTTTAAAIIPKSKSQDKGKAIIIEEPMKLKKKDQIQLDEEVTLKL